MSRIAILPAHDDSAASSRIRAYALQKALASLGHDARIGDPEGADVVFIQKRAMPDTVAVARAARRRGARVIYDVDDLGRTLWYFATPLSLFRLLHLANVVTTDTDGHREMLQRDYDVTAAVVVPDTIDYDPSGPMRPEVTADAAPLRVLWFGNAARYADALASLSFVETVVSTNADQIGALSGRFSRVHFVPWSRAGFVALLQSCALTVLPHDGSDVERAKSNNRMIASINHGVPAIVSRTPEYERTAQEAGVEYAVFDDEMGLIRAVEHLRSAAVREQYLDSAQPVVWREYSPEAVARKFLRVAEQASSASAAGHLRFLAWFGRATAGHAPSAVVHSLKHTAARWLGRGAAGVRR